MFEYELINLNDLKGYNDEEIKKFLRYRGIRKFDEYDIDSLKKISERIDEPYRADFNVSYVVDRLDKEFDLVKLNESIVINIELKQSKKDISQCMDNYKLLKNEYKSREIYVYCFESENNAIYFLNNQEKEFLETTFDKLNEDLSKIQKGIKLNININVNSVYSNPDFFYEKKYNLSSSQSLIKSRIISSDKKVNVVGGRAGCGKSLLALDLYNYYKNVSKNIQFLTPFKLNDIINSDLIKIIKMKTVRDFLKSNDDADIIIVDEAQRLSEKDILLLTTKTKYRLILFGDINQNIDNESAFESSYSDKINNNVLNMKQIIRTDDTFEIYARKILNISDKGFKHKKINKDKIKIMMYSDNLPDLSDCIYIEPSKSLYYTNCETTCKSKKCHNIKTKCRIEKEPHSVISSEFKNVVVFLCEGYNIVDNNITKIKELCTGNLKSQLYSIMTRTTDNLLLITDNILIYNYLMQKLEEM